MSNARDMPGGGGGMLKRRFDRYITSVYKKGVVIVDFLVAF